MDEPPAIPSDPDSFRLADTHNLGYMLARASRRWNQLLEAEFSRRGFPEVRAAHGAVLLPLFERDEMEGIRLGELAEIAGVTRPTMTSMAGTLVHAGLVRREDDPDDGRVVLLRLTDRGREFQMTAERTLSELEAEVASLLTPRRSRALKSMLASLLQLGASGEG